MIEHILTTSTGILIILISILGIITISPRLFKDIKNKDYDLLSIELLGLFLSLFGIVFGISLPLI